MSSALKVLHVITTLERGGAEKAVAALAGEQVLRYAEVTLLPLKGKLDLAELCFELGIKVDTSLVNLSPIKQLFHLRRRINRFDVVHAHLPRAELQLAVVCKPKTFLVTRHNSEIFFPKGGRLLSTIISRWITRKSSAVIAISNTVKSFLLEKTELGKEAHCVVIHYGIHLKKKLEPQRVLSDPIKIGTISRLVPQKNIPFLIDLVELLLVENRNVDLEIVGEGQLRNQILEGIDARNLVTRVRLLGKTSKIDEFLSGLDIFILASRYEGFGLVLLEAMSCSIPVMAPNIEIMREVLGEDHPGLYRPGDLQHSAEVFNKLVFDDKIRELCLSLQSNRLPQFSMDRYFQKHDSIYNTHMNLQTTGR
jgi:glycosyltransferase involved in cell wall biosynthesis